MLLAIGVAAPAGAGGFRVRGWAMQGVVDAAEAEVVLTDGDGVPYPSYATARKTAVDVGGSSASGIDAGYEFLPGLVLGARAGRIDLARSVLSGTVLLPGAERPVDYRVGLDSAFTFLLVGGTLHLAGDDRWSLHGVLYLGYADGAVDWEQSVDGGEVTSASLEGSGIADDFGFEVRYRLSRWVEAGAALHLFSLRIGGMSGAGGSSDRMSRVVSLDFDTISAGAGVTFHF